VRFPSLLEPAKNDLTLSMLRPSLRISFLLAVCFCRASEETPEIDKAKNIYVKTPKFIYYDWNLVFLVGSCPSSCFQVWGSFFFWLSYDLNKVDLRCSWKTSQVIDKVLVYIYYYRICFGWGGHLEGFCLFSPIGGVGGLEYPLISGEFKVGLGLISGP